MPVNAGVGISTVCPVGLKPPGASLGQRHELDVALLVRLGKLPLQLAVFLHELRPQVVAHQLIDHADAPRGIEHVDRRLLILRGDLHRRVLGAGRRAADQAAAGSSAAAAFPWRRGPFRRGSA